MRGNKYYKNPLEQFHAERYLLHNRKLLAHIESLNIDFRNKSVFEVGAGIGDHTKYLLLKGSSRILSSEGRKENLDVLSKRFKNDKRVKIINLDMDNPGPLQEKFEFGYCCGILYHLSDPQGALKYLSDHITEVLLLETCVSYFDENTVNICSEDKHSYSQSIHGWGSRPGRKWLYNRLKEYFQYVYMPLTQPDHIEFPLEWKQPGYKEELSRAVFIASRAEIKNDILVEDILYKQIKNETRISDECWNLLIQV